MSGLGGRSLLGSNTGTMKEGGNEKKKVTKKKSEKEKIMETKYDIAVRCYQVETPDYDLSSGIPVDVDVKIPDFISPDKDPSLVKSIVPVHDVNGIKHAFINAVSGSLICRPDFKDSNDFTRVNLTVMAERVILYDPEFVLKVALYTRKQLNIRTTANFLLALASNIQPCRPYLKKYYRASINLPSDWIEVAEIYQAFHDKNLNFGALPSALRKVMISKFPDFDKYQLAKYNKDNKKKKKKKKQQKQTDEDEAMVEPTRGSGRGGHVRGRGALTRGRGAPSRGRGAPSRGRGAPGRGRGAANTGGSDRDQARKRRREEILDSDSGDSDSSDDENIQRQRSVVYDDEETPEKLEQYPDSLEEFYKAKLPGTWEEERAGKRMKLPVPETWETQVSLKGNKASTWEALIDHKKLPFMAMLRNLRNLVKAGISNKHHNMIIRRLTDERQVVNSKQFPFQFFSAYEVLGQLEKDYENSQNAIIKDAEMNAATGMSSLSVTSRGRGRGGRGRGRGRGGAGTDGEVKWWLEKKRKKLEEKNKPKETPFDTALITRYRKALDTAVKIATTYNVQPIRGKTIVLCDVGPSMEVPCTAAKGLGKPRTMKEVSLLLGLMCKYSCENCDMILFDQNHYTSVELDKGTILDNLERLLDPAVGEQQQKKYNTKFALPNEILDDALRDRVQVDNVVFLSGGASTSLQNSYLSPFLKKYRLIVNPNLLYINISFAGKSCGFADNIQPEHDNDIYISGFSDQILRFIAERGDGGQLMHVEKIDELFNLKSLPTLAVERIEKPKSKPSPETPLPIVSNTPRWRTARVFISSTFRDMHGERDLLTRTLELCLTEISKCQFFVGLLGERYGWTPEKYVVPDTDMYDWVREYPPGASVTELEMHYAALSKAKKVKQKAFFYFRDSTFEKDIPKEFHLDFLSEDDKSKEKINKLKNRIRTSGLEVYDGYPCRWGGVVDSKPIVAGLEKFGLRDALLDETTHVTKQHSAMLENLQSSFTGRQKMMKECIKQITEIDSGILTLVGKPGTGKSALMASLIHNYVESKFCDSSNNVLVHIVGAAPGSTNIMATLRRLCFELRRQHGIQSEIPEDFKNIVQKFNELLSEAATACSSPLVLFIDGIDMMENTHQPYNMEWLPAVIPQNVVFVFTALDNSKCHKALQRHKTREFTVVGLDMFDKADVVRNNLAVHRKYLDESPFNNQLKLLLSKKEASNPLFLKLACEELRVFGVFEKINNKLKSMPHTVPTLLQEMMARLESDLGRELMSSAAFLLVCSRDGLDAGELHDLLSINNLLGNTKVTVQDVRNISMSPDKMLPAASFSYLRRSLQTFLNPADSWNSRLSLSNAEIESAVRLRYMKGSAAEQEQRFHRLLAVTWWRIQGFIHRKCQLGLGAQLMEDYQEKVLNNKGMEKEQYKLLSSPFVQQYKNFVSKHLHIINSYPALTWQQALNEPSDSQVYREVISTEQYKQEYMEWNNKPSTSDPCYLTISSLSQPVTCVAISPDSKYFACGAMDCLIRLYDLQTGQEIRTYRGHADAISDVCFAGKDLLCSASLDNTISIWHVEDGHRMHLFKEHTRRIKSCAADPSGKLLSSASWDCTVIVWNLSKGQKDPVNAVAFHPEGQLIVTGCWDSTLKIFDVFHKTRKAVLRGHETSVRDVAYSPSGRHIASAALDGDVKIWAAQNGTPVGYIRGHSLPINKLIFTPTGKELVTVSDDHKVKVWSGHLGKPVYCMGEESHGAAVSIALSPEGDSVATGYHEGQIRVFDVLSGKMVHESTPHTASVRCIAYSVDGKNIISGSDDCRVFIFDSTIKKMASLIDHPKPVTCLSVVANYIATGCEDFACRVFPIVKSYTIQRKAPVKALCTMTGHVAPLTSCTFSPDLSKLATASRDASVVIWDLRMNILDSDCDPIKTLHACHSDWITDCKWSNTGDYIVTSSNDFNLKIWDWVNCKEKFKLTGHMASINSVAFSYGCIVSSCSDGSVKVWSHKGTEITTLYGHTQRANSCDLFVRVSQGQEVKEVDVSDWAMEVDEADNEATAKKVRKPNIKIEEVLVATCGDDGTANEIANLQGHADKVISVASDSAGQVCSSSLDKSVKLWHPELTEDTSESGHNAEVTFTVSSLDDGIILTGSRDGTLKVWKKTSSNVPECVINIKAHTKSVNAATFLSRDGLKFVTAGDDNYIIVWNLTRTRNTLSIKKMKVFKTDCPVTSLFWNEHLRAKSGQVFFSSSWKGKISVWNTDNVTAVAEGVPASQSDWMLKIRFWNGYLCSTTANGSVMLWDIAPVFEGKGVNKPKFLKVNKVSTDVVDKDIPPPKRTPTFVLDVAGSGKKCYAVDSKGQITQFDTALTLELTRKIHAGPVSCIQSTGSLIFTGSHDQTIKVWDSNLKQVGLFFCPAPVMSLTISATSTDQDGRQVVSLVCGDQLGNIHFLTWRDSLVKTKDIDWS
ncbi:hypothetical protein KUTeg_005153 [Tegillarca granosa]|uniref:TROVE domain-containing protein n=1 Tax=Tegillarca granosa TaxID=220873 RepID=A0ABQ9FJ02_TEGGR|nr:hypothetical protein KUTeg_005153 [Tegillarca granosa]